MNMKYTYLFMVFCLFSKGNCGYSDGMSTVAERQTFAELGALNELKGQVDRLFVGELEEGDIVSALTAVKEMLSNLYLKIRSIFFGVKFYDHCIVTVSHYLEDSRPGVQEGATAVLEGCKSRLRIVSSITAPDIRLAVPEAQAKLPPEKK